MHRTGYAYASYDKNKRLNTMSATPVLCTSDIKFIFMYLTSSIANTQGQSKTNKGTVSLVKNSTRTHIVYLNSLKISQANTM